MMMTNDRPAFAGARIVLAGHADRPARVEAAEVSFRARVMRTLVTAGVWGSISTAVFFITVFDPFMTSMPTLVGAMAVYRSWKGRLRIRSFHGGCPRCGAEISIKANARISTPHPLVCYACHHEPELVFG
jgi:hypothetical protein